MDLELLGDGMNHVRRLGPLSLLVLMLFLGSGSLADGHEQLHWCGPAVPTGPTQLALSGRLVQRLIWGPPNFGENPKTDRRYAIWVLKLRYAVPVLTDSEFKKDVQGEAPRRPVWIRDMQLIPQNAGILDVLNSQLGRMITVVGSLWTAEAPAEATPVVMHVKRIEPASILSSSCDGRLVKPPI